MHKEKTPFPAARQQLYDKAALAEKARALGETRADLDLDAAAEVVSSLFTGTQFVSVATTGGSDLLERLARMWKVVLPGMVSDPEHWAILRASELIETTALEAA